MSRWLHRLRGALGMGVTWGLAWALAGILIGVAYTLGVPLDWFLEVFDAPLPALAVPGFFSGASFSLVLGVAGRNRRFDELSLPGFTAWGALGGVLLSLVPLSAVGLFTPVGAVVAGTLGVLGGASAAGTLLIARTAEEPRALERPPAGRQALGPPD
ncbi:hypothetical protein WI460_11330 [Gemmatimonadota bacterium Y43]|uniref:hypothetical protein n=1 Tax=Gaopeijia maritima TaxID=3119007 RepID=UPI003273D21D